MKDKKATKGIIAFLCCLLFATACLLRLVLPPVVQAQARTAGATLFEGARLIVGDGSAPIENSAFVVDATGHAAEVARIVERKSGVRLKTKTGKTIGEGSMWAHVAEDTIVKNSKEACPGLYVCGMCANAVFGGPRMGPIFGGMLLSGEKVAKELIERL